MQLVAHGLDELPQVDARLDNILNRADIELDMEVWGNALRSIAAACRRRHRTRRSL